ncbi:MAG: hypothetical protein NW216_05075 [Hyphomicrobium sp.]|nr:hypothetical protein [Hyphomicrobium sp.]
MAKQSAKKLSAAPRLDEAALKDAVVEKVTAYDLENSQAWTSLVSEADRVTLQGIDADPEAIIISGDKFSSAANVFVRMDYDDAPGNKGFSMGDSRIVTIEGHFAADKTPIIDTVQFFPGLIED